MRAIYCGVVEMICRTAVCVLLVTDFGYNAITWADQSAWLGAVLYLIPVTIITMRDISEQIHNEVNADILMK